MKTAIIIIVIVFVILIGILLYGQYGKTGFDATSGSTISKTTFPVDNTPTFMTPTEPWFLQYDRYAREAGVDVNAATTNATLPNLNTQQLRNENVRQLMMENQINKQGRFPDLYPELNNSGSGQIAENQSSAPTNSTPDANGPVRQQDTYVKDKSSIVGAGIGKEIGTSIADIGKSITDIPGNIGGGLGYAGYTVDPDYNLLPAGVYNNIWDYKQNQNGAGTAEYDPNSASVGSGSDALDKLPRAIVQKDFAGVSNIFAPNFIFLGKKDDYSIGFDGANL